jgi:hypothetical protein
VIRVYDEVGNVIETHQHAGDFKVWWQRRLGISNGLTRCPGEDGTMRTHFWPFFL